MVSLRIINACILTMDDGLEIQNGYIDIEGSKIAGFGSMEEMSEEEAKDLLDLKGKLVMPGLINAHTHTGMMPFRNLANDLPLETWLFEHLFPMEDKLRKEDMYWISMLGIGEMISTGTTTFADMYMFMDELARASIDSGIRADLCRGLQCFDEEPDLKDDRRIREAIELYEGFNGKADGRISVRLGPHGVYTNTPKYLSHVRDISKEYGMGIHIHLSETRKENSDCLDKYGLTPTAHLHSLGLLGRDSILAHGVHLNLEDLEFIKSSGASIVHNPGSNLKLGSGIAYIKAYRERGLNIALGTDSAASNNNLDMFREIYLAATLSKGGTEDSIGIKAYEALELATINGARALSQEDIGTIKVGNKADLIVIDVDKPHYTPINDLSSAIVYAGMGSDVSSVIVDGRLIYHQKEYLTIDMEKAIAEVRRISEELIIR